VGGFFALCSRSVGENPKSREMVFLRLSPSNCSTGTPCFFNSKAMALDNVNFLEEGAVNYNVNPL